MIRVAVLGAGGRMGGEVCRAVEAADDLAFVAAVDPEHAGAGRGDVQITSSLDAVSEANSDVAVDFTHPTSVAANVRWCLEHGVHAVVGTTGMPQAELDELRVLADASGANCIVAPNFALGAVLMMRFAAEAARYFDAAEVIELHHDGKADAPSGTALSTARAIGDAREAAWSPPDAIGDHAVARGADVDGVHVHAVRLPGLVAHQEVIFGAPGQVLSIRHDALDRAAFMPGVLLAIRAVSDRPGLTVGLGALLDRA
jgi:4-hydroxy-tetrahydrodipicolinate reductase